MRKRDDRQGVVRSGTMEHWQSCKQSVLPHANASRDHALPVSDRVPTRLAQVAGTRNEQDPFNSVLIAYQGAEQINAERDHGMFGTDEREIIVPAWLQTVESAGSELAAFSQGGLRREIRNI